MNEFKKNVKKRPGPNLTNSRDYAYSTRCNYNCEFGFL